MGKQTATWQYWHEFFARRSFRPTPKLSSADLPTGLPGSLARSLAVFQLGESGGGTVVEQAHQANLPSITRDYGDAMALFVAEEHRHADLLALCVWALGGSLIRKNWTALLFVFFRRLIGLRLKVLVLLAAEVVGICYYYLLASRLPDCGLRRVLTEIVADEQSHLRFHCDFLRAQTQRGWQKLVFVLVWRVTMFLAAVTVLLDHRQALKDMNLPIKSVCKRWRDYTRLAERLVIGSAKRPQHVHDRHLDYV